MSRALKVSPEYIQKVKLAVKRNSFPSQSALANEVGFNRSTIVRFLNGKPVDYLIFVEICEKLGLDWQAIALLGDSEPEDATTNQLQLDLVGTTIGERYKIIKLLGTGEYGKTYLAEDERLPNNPRRFIKQLRSESGETSKQLLREAQVLGQLNDYPQIPILFDSLEEEGNFYLVQQFIDGHNLSQELIEGQPWSEPKTISLMREILEILKFVHRFGVIHRAIHPQNLIRHHTDNKLVLTNFGSVKRISTWQGRTFSGISAYIPPEQAMGRPKLCSDIYAVAILGIQALTGLHPNKLEGDGTDIIWRDKVMVRPELANILDKMVISDYRQRYQSVEEVLQAFQQLGISVKE